MPGKCPAQACHVGNGQYMVAAISILQLSLKRFHFDIGFGKYSLLATWKWGLPIVNCYPTELKGGLNFGGVPSMFWLGNGSRNWSFWVVLLCVSFLFQYTQNWEFSHSEICLWLEICNSRRRVLVCGSPWRGGPEAMSLAQLHRYTVGALQPRPRWYLKDTSDIGRDDRSQFPREFLLLEWVWSLPDSSWPDGFTLIVLDVNDSVMQRPCF